MRDEDSQLLPVFPQVEHHHPLLVEPRIGGLRLFSGSHRDSHPREWKHLVAHKCDNQGGLAIIPKSETFFDPFFWILMSEDFTSIAGKPLDTQSLQRYNRLAKRSQEQQ